MNRTEQFTVVGPETAEAEDSLVEEDYRLRAEMERMLDYAVNHGLCTTEDASDWMEGFDACEKIEYKENLVMILAEKCLPSGEELADEYDEIMRSPYLSASRKQAIRGRIDRASVREREEIITEAKAEIAEKRKRYAVFNRLLTKIQVASLRKQMEQKFSDADLSETQKIIDELSNRDEKKEKLEVVTPDVQASLNRVRQLILNNEFGKARELLDTVGKILNFSGEYKELSREIDQKEIELARISLQAA